MDLSSCSCWTRIRPEQAMHLEILQFLTVLFVDDKVQVDSNGFVHSFQINLQNVQGPFKSVDVMFPFPEDLTDLLISTTLASSQGLGRFRPIPVKANSTNAFHTTE